jgi:hypothetical protein
MIDQSAAVRGSFYLKERGLTSVRLMISAACIGLDESGAELFSERLGGSASFVQHFQSRPLD